MRKVKGNVNDHITLKSRLSRYYQSGAERVLMAVNRMFKVLLKSGDGQAAVDFRRKELLEQALCFSFSFFDFLFSVF